MANKRYTVEIDDLDVEGPELSDEELLATRGGFIGWVGEACSCVADGYDYDNWKLYFY
jgi:hypothetical protein